jgi:hypothetical protein
MRVTVDETCQTTVKSHNIETMKSKERYRRTERFAVG